MAGEIHAMKLMVKKTLECR